MILCTARHIILNGSQTQLSEKHVHVGSPAKNNGLWNGGLTHFARLRVNSQPPTKEVGRCSYNAFAHKSIYYEINKSAKRNLTTRSSLTE